MPKLRQVVLARRPDGVPHVDDFRLEEAPTADPGEGEVTVRTAYVSVDPGMRARLSDAPSYAPPLPIGGVIESAGIGRVTASRDKRFSAGDWVSGALGWQEAGTFPAKALQKLPDLPGIPHTAFIGVLGIPGLTAYFGLLELGGLSEGQTVLVSSAAGAVGSAAGQIARLKGARAVGIAGGPEKCAWLTEDLGFAAAVDYKATSDLGAALRAECPDGASIFFDNVGGAILTAAVGAMAPRGRIVVSGQIADYNRPPSEREGLRDTLPFITHRLRMEGFVVYDYRKRFPEALAEMAEWVRAGNLRHREEVLDGIAALPDAFLGLFRGETRGRRLIRLDPDQ